MPEKPRATTPDPSCKSHVHGHVVDAATHEPVAGATVRLDGEVVALTNAAGRFALSRLCSGDIRIEVERLDYQVALREISLGTKASMEIELGAATGEVIVVEGEAPPPEDMRSTAVISGEALERTRGRAFAETMSDVPGVSQLRSGSGMAKPIVRGQFGRRLLLLVDGVRHRSQDWGLDHAPEIDPFVADEIRVVRGAAGVQYGPDAIGGAILVAPPPLLRTPGIEAEAHAIGFSDRGASSAMRVRGASSVITGLAGQVEGSVKRLRAPNTPDYPLDNTGAFDWSTGATLGYDAGNTEYTLSYRHYVAKLGVCRCLRIESSEDFFEQLERDQPVDADLYRAEFAIERPYQEVAHDLAIARARKLLPDLGTATATYAFQYDKRREFDVVRTSTGPQFDFRLTTHDADLAFEHNPLHFSDHLHLQGTAGIVGMAQVHGYGGLTLVPDHRAYAGGVYAIERLSGHDYQLEAGLRYDVTTRSASLARQDFLRLVRSGQLADDACGEQANTVECDSTFHTVSASIGGRLQLTQPWAVKLDLSTASRPPNPDEQYLNGTSPTFPVMGLGKPDLDSETTYSASLTSTYVDGRVNAEASVYANWIADYIYFAPAIDANGQPIFDVLVRGTFPRFVTRPVDAVFYGADAGLGFEPIPSVQLGAQLSMVRARNVTDDSYLVFVPPDRARGSVTHTRTDLPGLRKAFVSVMGTFVARQARFDRAADLAEPPDAYFMLDAEVGGKTDIADQPVTFSLQGTNLLNSRYRDYTSLLRYFADQPGWQLMLRLSVHYTSKG